MSSNSLKASAKSRGSAGGQDPGLASWLRGSCSRRHSPWKSSTPHQASAGVHVKRAQSRKAILHGKQARKGEEARDAGRKLFTVGNGLLREKEPNLFMILLTSLLQELLKKFVFLKQFKLIPSFSLPLTSPKRKRVYIF